MVGHRSDKAATKVRFLPSQPYIRSSVWLEQESYMLKVPGSNPGGCTKQGDLQ